MTDAHDEFVHFMKRRIEIANAFVNGDAAPLERISTHLDPASFFGPMGGVLKGAAAVIETNARESTSFDNDNDNRIEVLHMAASDELAYWVGIQRVSARLKGKSERVPMALRVTEIFRREDDSWRLLHRHADPLVDDKA